MTDASKIKPHCTYTNVSNMTNHMTKTITRTKLPTEEWGAVVSKARLTQRRSINNDIDIDYL